LEQQELLMMTMMMLLLRFLLVWEKKEEAVVFVQKKKEKQRQKSLFLAFLRLLVCPDLQDDKQRLFSTHCALTQTWISTSLSSQE